MRFATSESANFADTRGKYEARSLKFRFARVECASTGQLADYVDTMDTTDTKLLVVLVQERVVSVMVFVVT